MNRPTIVKLDQAIVDGAMWYTVQCVPSAVSGWVKDQNPELWRSNIDSRWYVSFNTFDMHEDLYSLLLLKWG